MDDLLAQLRADYQEQTERASRLLSAAKAERRDLTESEAGQYEHAKGELDDLSRRIAVCESRSDREREMAEYRAKGSGLGNVLGESRGGDFRDPLDGKVAAFLRGEQRTLDVTFSGLDGCA